MFALGLCAAVILVYLTTNVCLILIRNWRAHQFFASKEPKLPVLPRPNIFHGHAYTVTLPEKNWKIIENYHDTLGPTFGLYMCEQPWVCTKDIDLLKHIMVDQAHKHSDRAIFGLPFKEFNDSIFQVNKEQWRNARRTIAPAFTNHKVRSAEVTEDILHILEQLEDGINYRMRETSSKDPISCNDETGRSVERSLILHADEMFQRYTLAVIFLITYKQDKKIDFRAERDTWVEDMRESAKELANPLVAIAVLLPFMRPFIEFIIDFHKTGVMRRRIVKYIQEATDINQVARHHYEKAQRKLAKETGCAEKPFSELHQEGIFKRRLVDTIIDAYIDRRIRYDEFIGSTLFLLLAGFHTTADTITCLVWQLARNPQIQEKLRASIASDDIDSEYLAWCIQETVRYHPAVPLGTGRVLGEDVHINGLTIPKGSFVMPSTHGIHHDPSIWPEPERFWPERWQDTTQHHPAAFVGFGLGPRNCLGGKLAVHEIKLVMRLLMKNYRIERCSETPDKYDFTSPGLLYANMDAPIKVRLVALDE